MRARLSRRTRPKRVGSLHFDPGAGRAFAHGREIRFSPREDELFRVLISSVGETFSRHELVARLYGAARAPESNVIDVLVCTLRKKLAKAGVRNAIHTRRGEGYFLYVHTEGPD